MRFTKKNVCFITGAVVFVMVFLWFAGSFVPVDAQESSGSEPSKLLVVWTSGDKEVAMKMVYMYTLNSKSQGWWDEVRFLIWGPSSKLLSEDKELQDYLQRMKDAGVELVACKACADMYGVSGTLEALGVDVKYMGRPLTEMLKTGWVTLTF